MSQNSYAENFSKLTQAAADIADIASAVNEAVTGNVSEVTFADGAVMPSFQNVLNRLSRVEDTIAAFTKGAGNVELDDGTYRKIAVECVSKPAMTMTRLEDVSTFTVDPNWFFETLQYPRCVVKVDLSNEVDGYSDRAYVSRVIVDTTQAAVTEDIISTIKTEKMSYTDLITYLETNGISYKEDKDQVQFPLCYEKYNGSFDINSISLIQNETTGLSETWYTLSTINYSTVSDSGAITDKGHVLTVGDKLRFNDTLLTITAINQSQSRIKFSYNLGYDAVGINDTLYYYNDPFSEKVISVGIGIDELDSIYVKGINEKFNVLSREWSNPIIFTTNDLIYSDDATTSFLTYYKKNVADFGREWIARMKEGHVSSYYGKKPNVPTVNASDLQVVQINTQLEATLDSEKYNNLTSEIVSVKSNISSVRSTISSNKDRLLQTNDSDDRDVIQNTISSDTDKLNSLTTQYSSLVEELNTLLIDAGAINYTPKYHVRGFFAIPDPKYDDESNLTGKESIIGFETMYRYLHTDETGMELSKFNYTDSSNGTTESGTFTDWNLSVSSFLEKKYDEETDSYEWSQERIDGTNVVINQIDIPIRSGEKVEIKVRSISEAGYPYNPLKSDWSDSVIISFPDNLTTDDSVTTILNSVKDDMVSVTLQQTMSAAGVYTHISDSNTTYKHSSDKIEYVETSIDDDGNSVTNTMSVAEKLKALSNAISTLSDEISALANQ